MTGIQDPQSNRTTLTYTGNGKLQTVKDANSKVTTLVYEWEFRSSRSVAGVSVKGPLHEPGQAWSQARPRSLRAASAPGDVGPNQPRLQSRITKRRNEANDRQPQYVYGTVFKSDSRAAGVRERTRSSRLLRAVAGRGNGLARRGPRVAWRGRKCQNEANFSSFITCY